MNKYFAFYKGENTKFENENIANYGLSVLQLKPLPLIRKEYMVSGSKRTDMT